MGISHCLCTEASPDGMVCAKWTCEDRDVGLFSILFRTKKSIRHLVHGTEIENYKCMKFGDNECLAWEGDIESEEEVEWTRCECDGSCNQEGGTWKCDEFEFPKHRGFNH